MSYKTASPDRYALLKDYARENRKNATLAETVMWSHLRDNDFGVNFLRQHVVGDYIVDFVSREQGLIIEVDGGYHSEPHQEEDDQQRTQTLERIGYHVMRFSNEEVMFYIDNVITQIKSYFDE